MDGFNLNENASTIASAGLDELVSMDNDKNPPDEFLVPLQQWVEREMARLERTDTSCTQLRNALMLRKVTLAYVICKCVQHISRNVFINSDDMLATACSIDNFVVRVSEDESDPAWKVKGIEAVSPTCVLKLRTDEVLDGDFFDEKANTPSGKNVSALITIHSSKGWKLKPVPKADSRLEKRMCHLVGNLLRHVFTGIDSAVSQPTKNQDNESDFTTDAEPPSKRKSFHDLSISVSKPFAKSSSSETCSEDVMATKNSQGQSTFSMQGFGYSSNVLQVIKHLVDADAGDFSSDYAYQCLDEAINDLHLSLREPETLLFEQYQLQTLALKKGKLYGRSQELASIKAVFSRVHSSQKSEACFISGFSGCGKTRLVEECFSSVDAANGCVVTTKFDETSTQSPLTRTLSAFNGFCTEVNNKLSPADALELHKKFKDDFGESFTTLSRVLPDVMCFDGTPDRPWSPPDDQLSHSLNYHSLCFTVQKFMRVISTASIPLLLVLDDIQWSDPISMGVVHTVLSDCENSSCLMFVGCYRENEVSANNDHIVLGLKRMLSNFDVPITNIHLHGLPASDLNLMISDALGMLPRSCNRLSDIICRKTDGNPFFAISFLTDMVDRDIVRYSLREKRWTYDIDAVLAEEVPTKVVDFIVSKMTNLTKEMQSALKVTSCFGTQVDLIVVKTLSSTSQYPRLYLSMKELVEKSLIDFDGSRFRFIHDRVREAAYNLIANDERDQFHFFIGVLLQTGFRSELQLNESDLLFIVIEQLHHGIPALVTSSSHQIAIAELYLKAGSKRFLECNFLSSHSYMKTSVSLLPSDSWISHYELSLKCYSYLAKAAYPCGYIDEAKEVLNLVIEKAKRMSQKMHAYTLLVSLQATNDPLRAFQTCIDVLEYLGERVAEDKIDQGEAMDLFVLVKNKFTTIPGKESFHMEECENAAKLVMYFYTQLASLAFRIKPALCIAYISKCTFYVFEHKVKCKYTPNAIVHFASVLCSSLGPDTELGCKVGKIGMSVLKEHYASSDEAPATILGYYGQVGILNEKIQECEFMHGRGREIAMQSGNLYMSSLNLLAMIARGLQSGKNLVVLRDEIAVHLKNAHNAEKVVTPQLKNAGNVAFDIPCLTIYQQLVNAFIDGDTSSDDTQSQSGTMMLDVLYQGQMMLCTFYGKMEDAIQYATKIQTRSLMGILLRAFYCSIASIGRYRVIGDAELLDCARSSFPKLEYAAKCSEWNFFNKVNLIQAELMEVEGNDIEAENHYETAIRAAHSSKFINEEALACELAGMYQKRKHNNTGALDLFNKAKCCYEEWGSQRKVTEMKLHIEEIEANRS